MSTPRKSFNPVLATNRKARRNYEILEQLEAGIVLTGTEVKSARQSNVSLEEGFGAEQDGELWLMQVHIQPYQHGNRFNHDPVRPRKLLVNKGERERLFSKMRAKGLTIVPLDLHLSKGCMKVQIALGRGKDHVDKREDLKRKTDEREIQRALRGR